MKNKYKVLALIFAGAVLSSCQTTKSDYSNESDAVKLENTGLPDMEDIKSYYLNDNMRITKENGTDILDLVEVPNTDGDITIGSEIGDSNADITPFTTEEVKVNGEILIKLTYMASQFTPNAAHSFINEDENKNYLIDIKGKVEGKILLDIKNAAVAGDFDDSDIIIDTAPVGVYVGSQNGGIDLVQTMAPATSPAQDGDSYKNNFIYLPQGGSFKAANEVIEYAAPAEAQKKISRLQAIIN